MDQTQLHNQIKEYEEALAKLKAQLPKAPEEYCSNCSCLRCMSQRHQPPWNQINHRHDCTCLNCYMTRQRDLEKYLPGPIPSYYNHGGMCACPQCVTKVYL